MNDLCLVEPVDGLCEGIVIAVANAADRRFVSSFGQALAVSNADVLRSPVGMVNQSAAMKWPPVMECLLQRIEHEAGMSRSARPSTNNPASIGVDLNTVAGKPGVVHRNTAPEPPHQGFFEGFQTYHRKLENCALDG